GQRGTRPGPATPTPAGDSKPRRTAERPSSAACQTKQTSSASLLRPASWCLAAPPERAGQPGGPGIADLSAPVAPPASAIRGGEEFAGPEGTRSAAREDCAGGAGCAACGLAGRRADQEVLVAWGVVRHRQVDLPPQR